MRILELIQAFNREHYNVGFGADFDGMVRVEITYDFDKEFYEHDHVGYPDCTTSELEKRVIQSLEQFYKQIMEKS